MINDFVSKTPESEGIKTESVLKFIKKIKDNKINLHAFMIVRHGNVVAEGYYKPFDKDFKHRLYSSSKTVVALAIGKLIGEGRVKLTDKISSYFTDITERNLDKWMEETTIEDCLKMAVPLETDSYAGRRYKEWAWTFFNLHPSVKPSSTVFNYNTSGSFMLGVLVEKLTGKTFLEYLRPEFDIMGVSKDITCVKSPDGYAWGGSGVICTLRDFALIGDLVLNKGNYNGKQLIPKDYMEKATSKQIANLYENSYSQRTTCGYGYQIWISKDGFGLFGMGSQLVFCFPKENLMFVCQGDTQSETDCDPERIYAYFTDTVYENLSDKPLPPSLKFDELVKTLSNLELNTDFGDSHSETEKVIDGKKYSMPENPMGWKWFKFDFNGEEGVLSYENVRGVKKIRFGLGKMLKGTFPETHYYDMQVDTPSNRELNGVFCANWIMPDQLLVRSYITDTCFGNCFMLFGFRGKDVGIQFSKKAEFFLDDYCGFASGRTE